jgi:hypothetical protein
MLWIMLVMATSAQAQEPQEQARALSQELGAQLKSALQTAMREGGPVKALEVCNLQAPEIAQALSLDGVQVGRTALRVRNPENAPDAWEREQLDIFLQRMKDGDAVTQLEAVSEDGEMFRYMKAIPMQGMCMTCHGDPQAMPQELRDALAQLYPDDRATGFMPGQLRGAFTISLPKD